MNILHALQSFLRHTAGRQPEPEYNLVAKRPSLPVSSILRDLDEIFGLSLSAVGRIISSGNTIPHDEMIAEMLEWAKGADSEFAESRYVPRLEALLTVVQALDGHTGLNDDLEQILMQRLPKSLDPAQRSLAVCIQQDDIATLTRVCQPLQP